MSGWVYYYIPGELHDTDMVQEKPTLMMCDCFTFFYVMQLTFVDLKFQCFKNTMKKHHENRQ